MDSSGVVDGEVAVRLAALAELEALPEEPTLAQSAVVRPQVAAALALRVGPALAAGIEAVMAIALSEKEQAEVVAATSRLISYATAAQATVLAELVAARDERVAREVLDGQVERWAARSGPSSVGAELARVLKVAESTATAIVSRACYTDRSLPAAGQALAEGVMTVGQWQVVVEVTRAAAAHLTARLDAAAARLVLDRSATQLRHDLEALAARLDPDHHAEAVAAGVAARDVQLGRSRLGGCARLVAELPVEQARASWMWVSALARAAKAAGDVRGIKALRADLLVAATTGVLRDMLTAALTTAANATEGGGGGTGGGGGVRVPVPTPEDLARLIELNILITDTDDPRHGGGSTEPDEPREPAAPDDDDPDDDDQGGDKSDGGGGSGGPAAPDGPSEGVEPSESAEFAETDEAGGDREAEHGESTAPSEPSESADDTCHGAPEPDDTDEPAEPAESADSAESAEPGGPGGDRRARRRDEAAAIHALLAALAAWTGPDPGPDPRLLQEQPSPLVPVIIRWSTLTGADDQPAHLPGDGPLSAERVRTLACGGTYRWLHADPATGYLLHRHTRAHPPPPDHSWTSANPPAPPPLPEQVSAALRSPGYVPGRLLRAHIQVRDATCIGPSCHHPAHHVDLDHTVNYGEVRDGVLGVTDASNLGATCRRVHLLKTHGGWHLTQPSPGHFIWTTPLGYTYHRTATPLIPGWNQRQGASPRRQPDL